MRKKRQHIQAKPEPHVNASLYFHRTTEASAAAILRKGFRDTKGRFGTTLEYKGVWLSDVPVDFQEGAQGTILLAVEIDPTYVKKYEWVQQGNSYREYLVPATLLNRHATIRRATEGDEQRGDNKRQKRFQKMLRSPG